MCFGGDSKSQTVVPDHVAVLQDSGKSLLDAMPKPEPDKLAMAKPVYADMGRTGQGGGPRSLLGAA